MMNRMTVLLAFLAAFMFTSTATAEPPQEDKAATETKADDSKADDAKADDAKADDAKADDSKADDAKAGTGTGADTASGTGSDTGASGTDGKTEEKAEIADDEEALAVVKELVKAAKNGQWSLVIAFALMLLVYIANKFGLKSKLGPKVVPWAAAGMSMAGYLAASLMVEGAALSDAVLGGLATGAAAVGLWEMLFKHFLGGKKAEEEKDSDKEAEG